MQHTGKYPKSAPKISKKPENRSSRNSAGTPRRRSRGTTAGPDSLRLCFKLACSD